MNQSKTSKQRPESRLAPTPGSAVCVKYGCWRTPLKYMHDGESHQTNNGHFTIMVDGYYCPNCGAGYGGTANS